jgi:hypothetical protein
MMLHHDGLGHVLIVTERLAEVSQENLQSGSRQHLHAGLQIILAALDHDPVGEYYQTEHCNRCSKPSRIRRVAAGKGLGKKY